MEPTEGHGLDESDRPGYGDDDEQIRNFRLNAVTDEDARWLEAMLNREGKPFGTRVELGEGNSLTVKW